MKSQRYVQEKWKSIVNMYAKDNTVIKNIFYAHWIKNSNDKKNSAIKIEISENEISTIKEKNNNARLSIEVTQRKIVDKI